MSQVSPYRRSTAERGQHRKATAVFVVFAATILTAATVISRPDPPPPEDETKKEVVDWTARIADVEQALPQSDTPEVNDVKQRLASIAHDLESSDLSADAEASIQYSLNTLQQQAATLRALSDRPPVSPEEIDDEIASEIQSILRADEEAIRKARDQAERSIREKKQPAIRDMRLELRDQQDQATELRRQIAQVQREKAEFQAKAARAKALEDVMPDVRKYLSPFTAPGYLQPKVGSNAWTTERTAEVQPVSLSRLEQAGALDETVEGLERLYIFGGGKNPGLRNDRPLGDFPEYFAEQLHKPQIRNVVERAQQLLIQHGEALVEQQLLAP